MRLAAIYNVWDGEELLKGSIDQIKGLVDEIIIVWQDVSNFGEKYTPEFDEEIQEESIFIKYHPNLSLSGFNNEKAKRQAGIERAKELGCTHFILLDCDEYYKPEDFKAAKELIEEHDIEGSVVRLITYYKNKNWRLEGMEDYFVPFIHKLQNDTVCGYNNYPYWADPTRTINSKMVHELPQAICVMHHLSWVRNNIERKLNNSSAKVNFSDKIPKFIEEFETAKLGDVVSYYGKRLIEAEGTW
jgi:hypothetical protein